MITNKLRAKNETFSQHKKSILLRENEKNMQKKN